MHTMTFFLIQPVVSSPCMHRKQTSSQFSKWHTVVFHSSWFRFTTHDRHIPHFRSLQILANHGTSATSRVGPAGLLWKDQNEEGAYQFWEAVSPSSIQYINLHCELVLARLRRVPMHERSSSKIRRSFDLPFAPNNPPDMFDHCFSCAWARTLRGIWPNEETAFAKKPPSSTTISQQHRALLRWNHAVTAAGPRNMRALPFADIRHLILF